MPVQLDRINFAPNSTYSKNYFLKIPMKYSKNCQKSAMSKNTSNMFKYAKHHAKNHTSLSTLDHDTLFLITRYYPYLFIN